MASKKIISKPDTSERYKRAWLNTISGRPTQEGIDVKLVSKRIKEIEVKPTFEILKVNDYIHKTKYKENPLYKNAREKNDDFLGINILKFWYKWIETIGYQKQMSIWEVAELSGMPRLLQKLANKEYKSLASMHLAYRFATILNEPFIPIFTEDELREYEIPFDLYEKVVKRLAKNSLKPSEYGKRKITNGFLASKKNAQRNKIKWL